MALQMCERFGISLSTAKGRLKRDEGRSIDCFSADEYAVALNEHPATVWPQWGEELEKMDQADAA